MSNITKTRIELHITWDKNDPSDLTYRVYATTTIPDDTIAGGVKERHVPLPEQSITRTQFRGLMGAQIESQVMGEIDAHLAALGSGGHVVVDDTGD